MSQENVEIVRRYYEAWNAGGLDDARAFWSDEIEWQDAPQMLDGGTFRVRKLSPHTSEISMRCSER
jgi:ketosteroid isomerase-like protein